MQNDMDTSLNDIPISLHDGNGGYDYSPIYNGVIPKLLEVIAASGLSGTDAEKVPEFLDRAIKAENINSLATRRFTYRKSCG